MQKIPKLAALVPMRFPGLLSIDAGYGVFQSYEKYYYEHPRAFLSRFIAVLKELIHLHRNFWYVLVLGKNHFLSVRHDLERGRFIIEKLAVKVVRTRPEGDMNVIDTSFHTKTWKSPEAFLESVFQALLHYPPSLLINYYNNQLHARYTPSEFLRRTRGVSLDIDQFSHRVQTPSYQKMDWLETPGKTTTQSAETNFDRLLEIEPWGVSDWYETMGFSSPRWSRRGLVRHEFYEPEQIYKQL
jgi:hypothetical protein